jgi:hypothetical protein
MFNLAAGKENFKRLKSSSDLGKYILGLLIPPPLIIILITIIMTIINVELKDNKLLDVT